MEHNYEFICKHCQTKSYLNDVSKNQTGKDIHIKCHKCGKIIIAHLEPQNNTTETFGKLFGLFIICFIIGMILPSFGFFDNCQERSIISRPFCVVGSLYTNLFDNHNESNTNQEQTNIENAKISQDIKKESNNQITSLNPSSNENNNTEGYKSSLVITTNKFNQEIFNNIQVKGEETSKAYNQCTSLVKDKYSKINQVRDQSTLYQFDGDVRDCINEYLIKAKEFIQIIQDNPGQVTHNSLTSIQKQLISNSNYLKQISQQYSSASSQRHYYIHGAYQTNSLIQLAEIIGETSGAVASGSPIDTINSLQELSDWVHDNGGVIDTGWD